jgi:hypothetical protein
MDDRLAHSRVAAREVLLCARLRLHSIHTTAETCIGRLIADTNVMPTAMSMG